MDIFKCHTHMSGDASARLDSGSLFSEVKKVR